MMTVKHAADRIYAGRGVSGTHAIDAALAAMRVRILTAAFLRTYWMASLSFDALYVMAFSIFHMHEARLHWSIMTVLMLLAPAAAGIIRCTGIRVPHIDIARIIDERGGLENRTATAYELAELANAPTAISTMVLNNAAEQLFVLDLSRIVPLKRDATTAILALVVTVALCCWHAPELRPLAMISNSAQEGVAAPSQVRVLNPEDAGKSSHAPKSQVQTTAPKPTTSTPNAPRAAQKAASTTKAPQATSTPSREQGKASAGKAPIQPSNQPGSKAASGAAKSNGKGVGAQQGTPSQQAGDATASESSVSRPKGSASKQGPGSQPAKGQATASKDGASKNNNVADHGNKPGGQSQTSQSSGSKPGDAAGSHPKSQGNTNSPQAGSPSSGKSRSAANQQSSASGQPKSVQSDHSAGAHSQSSSGSKGNRTGQGGSNHQSDGTNSQAAHGGSSNSQSRGSSVQHDQQANNQRSGNNGRGGSDSAGASGTGKAASFDKNRVLKQIENKPSFSFRQPKPIAGGRISSANGQLPPNAKHAPPSYAPSKIPYGGGSASVSTSVQAREVEQDPHIPAGYRNLVKQYFGSAGSGSPMSRQSH